MNGSIRHEFPIIGNRVVVSREKSFHFFVTLLLFEGRIFYS
jgi:hypothetical protein